MLQQVDGQPGRQKIRSLAAFLARLGVVSLDQT